jgi:hypothetical protein
MVLSRYAKTNEFFSNGRVQFVHFYDGFASAPTSSPKQPIKQNRRKNLL